MSKDTIERIKALEIALNNESNERDFYLRHAERSTDPMGKKMFETLAKDEEERSQTNQKNRLCARYSAREAIF